MKKKICLILILCLLNSYAFSAGPVLMDMRNKIFDEMAQIKSFSAQTQDLVMASSMFDACVITVTQLDAYFSLSGILNSIDKKQWSAQAVDYLINWLNEIKKTNDLNIKSLDALTQTIEEKTKSYALQLKADYLELNRVVGEEVSKLSDLKDTLK